MFGGDSKQEDQAIILDVDIDGKRLYKQDVIKFVLEQVERRKRDRLPLEKQWTLNANFMIGNQYCDINPYRGDIEQLDPVYDWLERETFNRISPLIETRIANLKKINFLMKVNPRTNELDDYAKSEVSTSILRHTQNISDFDTKKNTMIAWNEICGNCFWLSWWDKDKGEEIGREQVTVQDESGSDYQIEKEEAIYEGDLDYGILTPYEVYPESIFKQGISEQRSIIIEQVKTVEDIHDIYGIKVDGKEIDTFALTPMSSGGGYGYESTVTVVGHRTSSDSEKITTYFERPSKRRPDGRLIIIIGDTELVYYGALPYKRIPMEQVICKEVAGQFFGKSAIEELIPLQRAYNGCINRIHEYIKRVAIQGYFVEEGSIDIEEYDDGIAPGGRMVYKAGTRPPVPIPNGTLPSEIMNERYNLANDMEYTAGVSKMMVIGANPTGVTANSALETLNQGVDTRLSLTGDYIRNSIKNLGKTWLEIYKRYANTRRAIEYVGMNNIGLAITWSNEDINSYDIEYTTENELVTSQDVQRQRFLDAYNMGLFTDGNGQVPQRIKRKVLEYMKVGNYAEIMNTNDLQIQKSQRENTFFENGAIPEVTEFDEHDIHVEEHLRYIMQMKFEILKMKKPEYAGALENHIRQHRDFMQQKIQEQMMQVQQMQGQGGPQ